MEYAIVGAVVGAFAGVVLYLAKKQRKKDAERIAAMTDEQKQTLIETPDVPAQGMLNAAVAQGLIWEVKRKGASKVSLVVMIYNTYYPNFREQFQSVDVNVKADVFDNMGLKEGDYVKVLLNQDKLPELYLN